MKAPCLEEKAAPLARSLPQGGSDPRPRPAGISTGSAPSWREEGYLGFYRGNGAMMIRIFPYGAIQFLQHLVNIKSPKCRLEWNSWGTEGPAPHPREQNGEYVKGFVSLHLEILIFLQMIKKNLGISGHVHRLMAGSMAGITAVICTYPLDMVRARLAFQVKGDHKYTGIIHAFKTIYTKEGGMQGFYRGLMPTIVGMAPYAGE
ncbi:solute carrier family 25 member 16-like [Paroedura picta]|uniref:solute carrier family 25 member 16-like n=1 Tax=Paroedura picta TaxID=143630 RepID=UPI00405668B4